MKRFLALMLSILLTLALPLGSAAWAETVAAEAPADAPTYYSHDGKVTLIDGAYVDTPVDGFEAAAAVVDAVLEKLGGDARTELEPWRDLTDAFGNRYYVFQQMFDNTTVLGGAVKVITDGSGNMLGLTSSIVSDMPEAQAAEGITAEAAEQLVLDHAAQTNQQALTIQKGLTDRMILPTVLEIDVDSDDDVDSRYVWVVYTDNPDSSLERASDLPYLAHYVTLTGEYLYSLPTIMPGDEAAKSGFDASYVFEFMEPASYTGYVDLSTGEEMEISIDVMRDKRTGMYYLGNLERRIVVADCWEYLYNDARVVLEYSPDNREWDQVGLLTLYNYCRAYDYYKEIGWIGGDGRGTPIMVLNNYCDANHKPVDNAAYMGAYLGWQLFMASQCNDYSQCLDVLAHEFTHCVTHSVMTYNAYKNDYGAINEAMSDIQGKTCEIMMEGAENVSWLLGDKSTDEVRHMDEPHKSRQPEFTWDVYYMPNAKTPTMLNDMGGVHTNSSLLNLLALRLYEKGGMTPEEGRAFWFTVDCAMVPGTDYPQLAELLPWALRASGLGQYETELQRSLDSIRLGVDAIPDTFDEDRALLTLRLPDNVIFDDGQWVLQIYDVDVDQLVENAKGIIAKVMLGDYSELPGFIQTMLESEEEEEPEEDDSLFMMLLGALVSKDDEEEPAEEDEAKEDDGLLDVIDSAGGELMDWVQEHFGDTFYMASTSAGQDGRTMRIVSRPGHALPMLFHGIFNESTSSLDDAYFLIYLGDRWIDLTTLKAASGEDAGAEDTGAEDAGAEDAEVNDDLRAVFNHVMENIKDVDNYKEALDLIFFHIQGGQNNDLPTAGLDTANPQVIEEKDDEAKPEQEEEEEAPQARKSRPKLEQTPDEAPDEVPDAA